MRGRPVRAFLTYKGQRNYPGWLWTATTGCLVGYESLLERDRVWLADFDPSVRWIASQPFWVSGRDGETLRRHVPDFLLDTAAGLAVVDVKPAEMLAEAEVAEALDWCRRLCAGKGWSYAVWSGDDPEQGQHSCTRDGRVQGDSGLEPTAPSKMSAVVTARLLS